MASLSLVPGGELPSPDCIPYWTSGQDSRTIKCLVSFAVDRLLPHPRSSRTGLRSCQPQCISHCPSRFFSPCWASPARSSTYSSRCLAAAAAAADSTTITSSNRTCPRTLHTTDHRSTEVCARPSQDGGIRLTRIRNSILRQLPLPRHPRMRPLPTPLPLRVAEP